MTRYVRHASSQSTALPSRLPILDIELTERCNNNCIHCSVNLPESDVQARNREMTTDQVKDVLNQAADLGCLQVRLTGGEPLIRPDFEEIYVFARQLGLRVLIFTNARNLTPRLADLLSQIPPLRPVEVTAYGMSEGSYEAVSRSPGSYSEFRRGVGVLHDHRVPFILKGVLLPPVSGETREFESWARRISGATRSPVYSVVFDLRTRRDDMKKNRLIQSLRVTPEEVVAFMARDEATYRAERSAFAARFMGPPGDRLFRCDAGRNICVDAYGCVRPCMGVAAPDLVADLRVSSLSDALESFKDLCNLKATNPEYLRRCAVCSLHGLCDQCPATSWSEHGTLDTPVEYHCEVAHAQARYLGWLREGEKAYEEHRSDSISANSVK